MPGAEGSVYYWKVRPMDLPYPGGVEGIFSATQRFVYDDAEAFTITRPPTVRRSQVPTLDWAPVPGHRDVRGRRCSTRATDPVKTRKTHSTSYTPMDVKLTPADGPVPLGDRALDEAAAAPPIDSAAASPSPTTPLDTSLPAASRSRAPATYDAPNLRWGAVAGADHYRVDIGDAVTGNWFADGYAPILAEKLYYPGRHRHLDPFLAEGTYMWRVTAYDDRRPPIGDQARSARSRSSPWVRSPASASP